MRLEEVDELADARPQVGHGPLAGLSEHRLEAGKGLFDWVGSQDCLDQIADASALVAGQDIHMITWLRLRSGTRTWLT